jgi:tagaturonate reductase
MAEIAPTIAMAESDKLNYIEGVMERFANPFVRHLCLSISLNSVSKFKVRVLPTLLESLNGKGEAPKCLCLALAALIRFYKVTHRDGDRVMGTTVHGPYPIQDDAGVMDKMELLWNNHNDDIEVLSRSVLEEVSFWGEDLSVYPSIVDHVKDYLGLLVHEGPEQAIKVALGIK